MIHSHGNSLALDIIGVFITLADRHTTLTYLFRLVGILIAATIRMRDGGSRAHGCATLLLGALLFTALHQGRTWITTTMTSRKIYKVGAAADRPVDVTKSG